MSDNCLFCKIFKGEIPATKIFESENVVGFVDLYPQAKKHYLFIHKNHTGNVNEMAFDASTIVDVYKAISEFTKKEQLDQSGFRVVTNTGKHAGQTIFHTHFHVLGGEQLGHFGS